MLLLDKILWAPEGESSLVQKGYDMVSIRFGFIRPLEDFYLNSTKVDRDI